MIDYRSGRWHVHLLFQLRGSVFPKAVAWALPSAAMAYATYYWYYIVNDFEQWEEPTTVSSMWSGFTFILGFLVVFRTQQAYQRYWEGATLLRQARGEWFNAYSSLIAFSTTDHSRKKEVERFQHLLARLMSILNCVALQTITDMVDDHFITLDTTGLELDSLKFLASKKDPNQRMEIIIQWVQRTVIESMSSGLLPVPAPVITRFFQELSRGAVNLNQARNMTEIPFPFPYAQLLTCMLCLNCIGTPLLAGLMMRSGLWASVFTFVTILAFWGTNYIAAEIESPFGDDTNDLPLDRLQEDINASLWTLLERPAQEPPQFIFDKETHRRWLLRSSSFSVVAGEEVQDRGITQTLGSRNSTPRDLQIKSEDDSSTFFNQLTGQATKDKKKSKRFCRCFKVRVTNKKRLKMGFASSHPSSPTVFLAGTSSLSNVNLEALAAGMDLADSSPSCSQEASLHQGIDLGRKRPSVIPRDSPRVTSPRCEDSSCSLSSIHMPARFSGLASARERPSVSNGWPCGLQTQMLCADQLLQKLGKCIEEYVACTMADVRQKQAGGLVGDAAVREIPGPPPRCVEGGAMEMSGSLASSAGEVYPDHPELGQESNLAADAQFVQVQIGQEDIPADRRVGL